MTNGWINRFNGGEASPLLLLAVLEVLLIVRGKEYAVVLLGAWSREAMKTVEALRKGRPTSSKEAMVVACALRVACRCFLRFRLLNRRPDLI